MVNHRATNLEKPKIRCAIYTRKSVIEGLEQEFNTLDAQREAAEAFIASQRSEGWVCLPNRYDDGGFTGGNIERPALRQLMDDVAAGQVDCILVYKVDRLSRSLMDFAAIMGTLERHGLVLEKGLDDGLVMVAVGPLALAPVELQDGRVALDLEQAGLFLQRFDAAILLDTSLFEHADASVPFGSDRFQGLNAQQKRLARRLVAVV